MGVNSILAEVDCRPSGGGEGLSVALYFPNAVSTTSPACQKTLSTQERATLAMYEYNKYERGPHVKWLNLQTTDHF